LFGQTFASTGTVGPSPHPIAWCCKGHSQRLDVPGFSQAANKSTLFLTSENATFSKYPKWTHPQKKHHLLNNIKQ